MQAPSNTLCMRLSNNIIVLVIVFLIGVPVLTQAEWRLGTGVRYNWARDDLPQRTQGTEMTYPFSLHYTHGEQFSLRVDTGYAAARVDYSEGDVAKLSNVTDMLINLNYAVPKLPFALSLGVSINAPTGKERVTDQEQNATIGEANDVFGVEKFGEGLNVGLSVSAMKQFATFGLGLNGLYVYKGEYDPTAEIDNDTLDPGDQFLVAGLVIWQPSDAANIVGLLTYSAFSPDHVEGQKNFQEGATVTAAGTVTYRYHSSDLSLSEQIILPQKDREPIEDEEHHSGNLEKEPENSGGITMITSLSITYPFSKSLKGTLLGDMKYYGESDRTDPNNGLAYAGQRIRYSIGTEIAYAIMPQLTWTTLVRYFRMREDKDLYLEQAKRFEGIHVSAEMTYTF